MNEQESALGFPHPARKAVPWRRDGLVLARMALVQRRHFQGWSNRRIAVALDVDEGTVRNDRKRLNELWLEQIGQDAERLRSEKVTELTDIKHRALEAADFDRACEEAVLFGHYDVDTLGGIATDEAIRVIRDDKGRAEFRGQKAQSLNVARQAVMDQAKVLGLIIEKQEHSGEGLVRIYEREVTADGGG